MDIAEKIRDIVARQMDGRLRDRLAVDDDLWLAGMTSLDSVSIMIAVEDEFEIEFPDSYMDRRLFASCQALADAVARLTAVSTG